MNRELDAKVAEVRERPILMSAPMVRAILDGRKTQTRRVVRIPEWIADVDPNDFAEIEFVTGGHSGDGFYAWHNEYADEGSLTIPCPYGVPGDRLWVKETFARIGHPERTVFRANEADDYQWSNAPDFRWKPSIFMPRSLSRLTLEVTEVRVHRLHETQEDDARAEGVEWPKAEDFEPMTLRFDSAGALDPNGERSHTSGPARCAFERLWDSINGKRPGCAWADNPWVWAISFRRLP